MTDTTASLRRKIKNAENLQSVVRTMKAMAASSIGQFEQSVQALVDYHRTVELGLGASIRASSSLVLASWPEQTNAGVIGAIVFGSDQGLVGQFNELVADYAIKALRAMPGKLKVWAVGDRVHARLIDAGLAPAGLFSVPNSVKAIAPFVGRIQLASEVQQTDTETARFYIFHNCPRPGGRYEPSGQRLLPLDSQWQQALISVRWPTTTTPETIPGGAAVLGPLIREYLFVSLFRACAQSLVSENASRLAAMQRAEKNIDELLEGVHSAFNRLRQNSIDEELFDVISGYELLTQQSFDIRHEHEVFLESPAGKALK